MTHSHSILSRAQLALAFGLAVLLAAPALTAQAIGTAFTYQGELRDAGSPASASYDFAFRLFDAADGGSQIGSTLFLTGVPVQDGLFSVELDFGPGQFAGDAQWLQIAVRPAGGSVYENLLPRTAVTPTPYALAALTALDGSVSSASIASGAVGTSQINSNQVQRRVSGSCPEGQYLRAVAQDGTVTCGSDATGNDWSRGGNAGTDASVDFLGTTDFQAFEIRTRNARSLRLVPSGILFEGRPITANVIAGSHANTVNPSVRGATIAGGGVPLGESDSSYPDEAPNEVTGNYGTVGGGYANRAGGDLAGGTSGTFAVVGGGRSNRASGGSSSVVGGTGNEASGSFAHVGGGNLNLATGSNAVVSGGQSNSAAGTSSGVGSGVNNVAAANTSRVGGGSDNTAGGIHAVVSGGSSNAALGSRATVAGGLRNRAEATGSAVLGGEDNVAGRLSASVAGGLRNCAGGDYSLAAGHRAKVRPPVNAGLGGTSCNDIGDSGDLLGDRGTFVWADSQSADFISTGVNQFLVRAAGGVALNDNSVPTNIDLVVSSRTDGANADLMLRPKTSNLGVNLGATSGGTLFLARASIAGNVTNFTNYAQWNDNGQFRLFVDNPIKPTAGGFAAPSDARLKQDITPLDGALDQLLALRGVRFAYRPDAPEGLYAPGEQTGFIAQEVEAVFPDWVSEHDSGYKLVAPKGFDALAVEALRELRIEKDVQIEALQADNLRLQTELAELRATVKRLAAHAGIETKEGK